MLIVKVSQNDPLDSSSQKNDQVDSKIKDVGLGSPTGCPRKNAPLFWGAIATINFELGLKVEVVLKFSGSQL